MSIFLFQKIQKFYAFFKCKSCFSAYNLSFAKPSTFCETVHFAGGVPRIQKEAFLAALCSKGGHRSREVASPIKNQKVTHFQNATLFRALVRAWGMVSGLGITLLCFWANRSFFAKKWANEWFPQKNKWFAHSLTFGEQPERIAHGRSFLVRDLSDSLTLLIFKNKKRI